MNRGETGPNAQCQGVALRVVDCVALSSCTLSWRAARGNHDTGGYGRRPRRRGRRRHDDGRAHHHRCCNGDPMGSRLAHRRLFPLRARRDSHRRRGDAARRRADRVDGAGWRAVRRARRRHGPARSTDAEYRAKASAFFRKHRDTAYIALTNLGPVTHIVVEMFRVGTGIQLKGVRKRACSSRLAHCGPRASPHDELTVLRRHLRGDVGRLGRAMHRSRRHPRRAAARRRAHPACARPQRAPRRSVMFRVSAAERMRETYRSMFDSSPQPMFVTDPATLRFLEVNDAAVRQYDYTRSEEFLKMSSRTDLLVPGGRRAETARSSRARCASRRRRRAPSQEGRRGLLGRAPRERPGLRWSCESPRARQRRDRANRRRGRAQGRRDPVRAARGLGDPPASSSRAWTDASSR